MWLVRKTSGDPVYFQCAVLPLEDYPMSNRGVTYDASALPAGSSSSETPALLEVEGAPTGVNALLLEPTQQQQAPGAAEGDGEEEEEEDRVLVPAGAGAATTTAQQGAAVTE